MRSLLDDMTLSELTAMRDEQGMSNREIADALGVSYHTILKILGKQPTTLRKERTFHPVKAPDATKQAVLIVTERTHILQGEFGRYHVNSAASTVQVCLPEQTPFHLTFDQLSTLYTELAAILQQMEHIRLAFEAW